MHRGKAYHDFMLASRQDLGVRSQFRRLVYRYTPRGGTILDFGAGTGIDAKVYAEKAFRVLVYEPCAENRAYLREYCREEISNGTIVVVDLEMKEIADTIVANFAVLNLLADQRTLFTTFDRVLAASGYVVVNLLNPFYLGDARYRWWRENLIPLLRNGCYVVEGNDGPVYRFTPAAIAHAARPAFRRIALYPRGPGVAMSRYMFLVFRKNPQCP